MIPGHSTSDFKDYKSFHFFYYSRKDGNVIFLLTKNNDEKLSHITGELDKFDPGVLFSVGRKIINLSSGLLVKRNLDYFSENSTFKTIERDMLQLCKPNLQVVNMPSSYCNS